VPVGSTWSRLPSSYCRADLLAYTFFRFLNGPLLELIARRAFDPLLLDPFIGEFSDAAQILLERATKVTVRRKRVLEAAASA
jgi:hypothetical protein